MIPKSGNRFSDKIMLKQSALRPGVPIYRVAFQASAYFSAKIAASVHTAV
jgi:hypothetical protein